RQKAYLARRQAERIEELEPLEDANNRPGGGDRTPKWFLWAEPIWDRLRANRSLGVTRVEDMIRGMSAKRRKKYKLPDDLARAIRHQKKLAIQRQKNRV